MKKLTFLILSIFIYQYLFGQQDELYKDFEAAVYLENLDKAQQIINKGFNINYEVEGYPILADIISYHYPDNPIFYKEMVKLLIKNGADVNITLGDSEGLNYPLMFFVNLSEIEITKLLVEKGADINDKDEEGFTPLNIAVGEGHTELVKFLVEKGGDINVERSFSNGTPLHTACAWERFDIAKFLLENGANLEAKDDEGCTPIFYAVMYGYIELVEMLNSMGANTHVQDNEGNSLMGMAISNGDEDLVLMLKQT